MPSLDQRLNSWSRYKSLLLKLFFLLGAPSTWYICLVSAQNSHRVNTSYLTHKNTVLLLIKLWIITRYHPVTTSRLNSLRRNSLLLFTCFKTFFSFCQVIRLLRRKNVNKYLYLYKHRAQFGWPPLSDVGAVTKPRPMQTHWNFLGCPAPNSPNELSRYWAEVHHIVRICGGELLCNKFFPIMDTCLGCEDIAQQSCAMVRRWRILRPVFPASRVHVQHISGAHSKFALRPHHVWNYGRYPISNR